MENTMQNNLQDQKSLPWFGIPRLFPYLKKYRKTLTAMVCCGLLGTGVDILMPVLQRYALNHFIAGKTLDTLPWYILISHRITTLSKADKVLVLDHGRVAQFGSPAELSAQPGLYRQIEEIQSYHGEEVTA